MIGLYVAFNALLLVLGYAASVQYAGDQDVIVETVEIIGE